VERESSLKGGHAIRWLKGALRGTFTIINTFWKTIVAPLYKREKCNPTFKT